MRVWLQEKQKDISEKLQEKLESRNSEEDSDEEEEKEDEEEEETKTESQEIEKGRDLPEDDILKMVQEDVEKLIKKVCMKAELLTRLETPKTWKYSDFSEKNLRQTEMTNNNTKEESVEHTLRKTEIIESPNETVTNYENLSNKEIFTTCSSSILAVLQCSSSSEEIMKTFNRNYINSMYRY